MQQLICYLSSVEPGPISDTSKLEAVLSECWDDFTGGEDDGMAAYKLRERMEGVIWEPPILSFVVERHGGTVLGSTRAELERWTLDVRDQTAVSSLSGHRQLQPMLSSLNLNPIAEGIVHLIVAHEPDVRLKWNTDGSVGVLVSKVLPKGSAAKQTLEGRRKRFRTAVSQMLQDKGWEALRPNVYQRQS